MASLSLAHIYYEPLDAMSWYATATVSGTVAAPLILWCKSCTPLRPYPSINDIHHIQAKHLSWQKLPEQTPLSILAVAHSKRQQQRDGVRLLLRHLLNQLNLIDDLDDAQFPYRLVTCGYYICFSHSDDHTQRFTNKCADKSLHHYELQSKVAVAISRYRPIGIDIEAQLVAWRVVQRYYHSNELALLNQLAIAQRNITARYLWQLKESLIKVHNYTLAQGLGIDYSVILPLLITKIENSTDNNSDQKISIVTTHLYKSTSYQIAILPKLQTLVVF